jgi:hypothetical protein
MNILLTKRAGVIHVHTRNMIKPAILCVGCEPGSLDLMVGALLCIELPSFERV